MVIIAVYNHLGQLVHTCGKSCHNNTASVCCCPCRGVFHGKGSPRALQLYKGYHQVVIPKAQAWQQVHFPGGKVTFQPVQLPLF